LFNQYKNDFLNIKDNNNNNSKFAKFKHSNTIGQKIITNDLVNDNIEKSHTKGKDNFNSDIDYFETKNVNQNMLDLISQNIEINSLNLNNPKYFYSNYFSNIINKKEKEKEKEKEKDNVGSRLSNIKKLLEKHKK
jgi:hypothetical protein